METHASEGTDAPLRVLLGGIPLGCDNIGDEAIVACVVRMVRESAPGVVITVATADPATAERLGVATVPPFGFAGYGLDGFAEIASSHDAYVWCGATGLSDYPHTALDLLDAAQKVGTPTFIWGVGMDDALNPAFFRLHGRRRAIFGALGLVNAAERRLHRRLKRRIARILPRCRGIWLRDMQSAAVLTKYGFSDARVAADSAILLCPPVASLPDKAEPPLLGLCISAQRRVADMGGVQSLVNRVRAAGFGVLGIPMNPKTDRPILEKLGVECIDGTEPEDVVAAAARCGAVLSSRLHLLILAANAGTPGLGIARGSKLANWLSNFDSTVEGDVESCDWGRIAEHAVAVLRGSGVVWGSVRQAAYTKLRARFESARVEFAAELEKCRGKRICSG